MRKSPVLTLAALVISTLSWLVMPTGSTLAVTDVAGFDWMKSLDGSGRWSSLATSGDGLIAISGYDLALSKIRITRNGGATWAELDSSPSASWNELAMSDDGSVMVLAGSDYPRSNIWVSTDSGANFTLAVTESPMEFERIAISSNGARILVESNGGVLLSTDSGSSFSSVPDLAGLTQGDVAMTSDGLTMYGAYFGGGVMRSTDGGSTWSTLASAGTAFWSTFDVSSDGTTLMGVISYNGGGVRVSTDSGATFNEPSSVGETFEYQFANGAVSRDGKTLIASSYGSEPMISSDKGNTWVPSTAGKQGWLRFAISNDGSRIYASVENSGVWRRTPVPPPTVTGLSNPLLGVGGIDVYIYGTNFAAVSSVTVDGVSQTFSVLSRNTIRITPAATSKSEVVIAVTTANGTASTTTTVVFPSITRIQPDAGPETGGVTGGGTILRVFGNFSGVTVNSATIGGRTATIINSGSGMIDLTVPPGTPGVVDVVLETSAGQLRSNGSFTYYKLERPSLQGVAPTSVSWAGGSTVTLTGPGMGDATAVSIAGKTAPIVERSDRNTVQVIAPASRVGLQDITVTNPAGTGTSSKVIRYAWQSTGSKATWSGFGPLNSNGALNAPAFAFVTMPNGDLIVGGAFSDAASIPEADFIVRWNGSTWSALGSNGSGEGALNGNVRSLAVDNDGSIIAVGDFRLADDTRGIARYLNGSWTSVGGGLGADGRAVVIAPDGTLYVGGQFQNVGGQPTADYVVRLDRQADKWIALGSNGSGNGALNGTVRSLAVTSDALIAGGHFTNAAGLAEADYIARWNGSSWSAMGSNGHGDGALPAGFVTTSLDVRDVDGSQIVLAGTCRGGGIDGSAHFFRNGQWNEVKGINLDQCVRDVALLPDGRAVLAGWFTEILPGGNAAGLIVGSDSVGWESLSENIGYVETIHIDRSRHQMYISSFNQDLGGDLTADYVAVADTAFLERAPITVTDPGIIKVTNQGGSTINLSGSGFGPTTSVTVGDSPIQSVTVSSPTQISFTAPSELPILSTLTVYNHRSLVSFPRAIMNITPPTVAPPSEKRIAKVPSRVLARLSGTLYAGSTFSATFRGHTPDSWVYAYFASKPKLVATGLADENGTVRMTITIPELFGDHSLVLYEPTKDLLRRQSVQIIKQELPATGADLEVLPVALLMLMMGCLLIVTARRQAFLDNWYRQ